MLTNAGSLALTPVLQSQQGVWVFFLGGSGQGQGTGGFQDRGLEDT